MQISFNAKNVSINKNRNRSEKNLGNRKPEREINSNRNLRTGTMLRTW